jgi:aminopeptidase
MNNNINEKDLEKWADYLLNHSLGGIKPKDVVMVKGEHIAWPLISILQDKIFRAGAIADINIIAPDNNRGMVWGASITKNGSIEQIAKVPKWFKNRYESMTKYIEILGSENPDLFSNLPEKTSKALFVADEPFKSIRLSKQWVITLYPTQGFADIEGINLKDYSDIIVSASITDPKKLDEVEEPIFQLMEKSNMVRIITKKPDTKKNYELNLDISNRNAVKCTGTRNFPDGEVFTSPNADKVNGEIFVDLPVYYNGTSIQGIYLKIEKGIIVDYSANEGFDTLKNIIETDKGSHRLGEVALGMNSGITKALKHPLFVEKVGGTLHIAIGASYDEPYSRETNSKEGKDVIEKCVLDGVLNRSAQHVDIVTDFRGEGAGKSVYFDDIKLEIRDNIWVIPDKNA